MELTRHGAHTFWGLPVRIAAIIAAAPGCECASQA